MQKTSKRPAAAKTDQTQTPAAHAARTYGVGLRMDPSHRRVRVRDLAKEMLGEYPAPPTIWRWMHGRSKTGLALPGLLLAGTWFTTRECFNQWLELRTRIKLGMPVDVTDAELSSVGLAD